MSTAQILFRELYCSDFMGTLFQAYREGSTHPGPLALTVVLASLL